MDMHAPSELVIVDLFTKLIFGGEPVLDEAELSIIAALRLVDSNVMLDDLQEMGIYLRALGVKEMIALVRQVKQQMESTTVQPGAIAGVAAGQGELLKL